MSSTTPNSAICETLLMRFAPAEQAQHARIGDHDAADEVTRQHRLLQRSSSSDTSTTPASISASSANTGGIASAAAMRGNGNMVPKYFAVVGWMFKRLKWLIEAGSAH
jgi:hypothetical protein